MVISYCHGVNISVVFVLMFFTAYSSINVMLRNGRTGHTWHIVKANFMLVNILFQELQPFEGIGI